MRSAAALFALLSIATAADRVESLPVGKSVIETHGRTTVVAFISARCPVSNAFNDRMSALYRAYSTKDVQFVFLDANANETAVEVEAFQRSAAFPFAVLQDPGNKAADRLGAMSTPETFVIDSQGVVRYHGFIEDSQNAARAKVHGLRDALDAVLENKEVVRPETKSFGCTIKRVRRTT